MNKIRILSANIGLVIIIIIISLYLLPRYSEAFIITQGKAEARRIEIVSKRLAELPEDQRKIYFEYLRARQAQ